MGLTKRVLVTRPEPGATATAARLTALGHQPVLLPLTRIVPVSAAPVDLVDCDAVIFTSANGVRHAPNALSEAIGRRPVHCVGEATAETARLAGIADPRTAAGDATALAAQLAVDLPPGGRVLHVAGRDRTSGFDDMLTRAGLLPQVVEVYAAEAIDHDEKALQAALGDTGIDAVLVYSQRAGRLLAGLLALPIMRTTLGAARFMCISANAATALSDIAGGRIAVAASPDENALLALLDDEDGR